VKPTVLVFTTTNWVPTARLAVALAAVGFRVEGLCPPEHPVVQTQAASRLHIYRGLAPLGSLKRAFAASKPDLIVPGDDLAVRQLQQLRWEADSNTRNGAQLRSVIERSLGPAESFAITDARAAFTELARQEGIRVPESAALETSADVQKWVERIGLPIVLKADGTSGGAGVRVVHTAAEAQSAFRQLLSPPLLARALKRAVLDADRTLLWPSLSRQRPAISAQAFVAGHEATSTIVCWKGTVLAALHFEVLRKCSGTGHATVVRRIDHAEMSAAASTMVARLGLSGLCGFDFMLEANSGHAYLIEINPRATQVVHLMLGAGRDLPAALYGAVLGEPVQVRPAITANDTIALFPHEWARDPESEFLRAGFHDVPWEMPELVHACMQRSRKQSTWYERTETKAAGNRGIASPNEAQAPLERSAAARIAH
jgi:Carbamoyl-phosphate synthase L chain, ATP binding domain